MVDSPTNMREAIVCRCRWYDDNSGGETHNVCGKDRNGYGLCDMSGNVWSGFGTCMVITAVHRQWTWGTVVDLTVWRAVGIGTTTLGTFGCRIATSTSRHVRRSGFSSLPPFPLTKVDVLSCILLLS